MGNSALGVVSPCSTCRNQRAVSDREGRANVCPRRAVTAQYLFESQGTAYQQVFAQSYEQLTITGTGADPSLTAPLSNPVYDKQGQSVLVWIAKLRDNPAKMDPSTGQLINPPITDPSFTTDYIVCSGLPYVPNSDEHGYFLKGALREGETVIVHDNQTQYTADGTQLYHIAGSVDRASNAGSLPCLPTIEDNCPQGT